MADPAATRLSDYKRPDFDFHSVEIEFDLGEESTLVTTRIQIQKVGQAKDLELNGEKLQLKSISIQGQKLKTDQYEVGPEKLKILGVPDKFMLETVVQINPTTNVALEGLYFKRELFCTQNEAEGFRRITYYLDRPDVMSKFKTWIRADKKKYPILLSNGNLISKKDLSDGRHEAVWEDPFKKPCYLFALVGGKLSCLEDSFTTRSGRSVKLQIFVKHGLEPRCQHAMESLKRSMKWDEDAFGREYDLDLFMIVAAEDFNAGAMENKGLNIFNSSLLLADPQTATDMDYERIEAVVGHEYFHNWTGNRITLRDWFQVSLKEGLTVFRDQEFSSDMGSRGVKRIDDVTVLRTNQFPEDAGPMAHPIRPDSYIEINNFYTLTVYEKGAEVIRMLHTLLGADVFRKGMDYYFETYDGKAITTDDFVAAMERASGKDLTQFRIWYRQAGTPTISMRTTYHDDAKSMEISLSQKTPPTPGQPTKDPVTIPVRFALLDPKGKPVELKGSGAPKGAHESVLELNQAEQKFLFKDVPEGSVPSVMRGFSAPVYLDWNGEDDDLAFLASHDNDPFNRWEALQRLYVRVIFQLKKDVKNKKAEVPASLLTAFKKTLTEKNMDMNVLARLLELPSEAYLAQLEKEIDIDGICKAREMVRGQIAEHFHKELWNVVTQFASKKPYAWNENEVGRRAFRSRALKWLCLAGDKKAIELTLEEMKRADNMTDEFNSLQILANVDCPQRVEALSVFYNKWKQDSLVMNKWLSAQATSCLDDTIDRLQKLLRDPVYDPTNPNKVYSLIRNFGLQNAIQFHNPNGGGYSFIADQVLLLDSKNPQVASRVVSAFNLWKRYDGERRKMMESQLKRIISTKPLSNNVFEIVSRSLN